MRGRELECVALALLVSWRFSLRINDAQASDFAQFRIATEQRSIAPCALVIVLEVFGKLKATGFEEA